VSGRQLLRRRAARVLPFDADGRVLLLRGVDPSAPDASFWFTVGGGLEAGESDRAAAVRELAEETGLAVTEAELRGPVFAADDAFAFDRWWIEQSNVFFAVRVDAAASPGTVPAVPGEVATLQGRAWWTVDQLRDHVAGLPSGRPGRPCEPVYPPTLADIVETARAALEDPATGG
jgi:8-oxo-dGTP pyrophosphatase MutT (NUDIX family)